MECAIDEYMTNTQNRLMTLNLSHQLSAWGSTSVPALVGRGAAQRFAVAMGLPGVRVRIDPMPYVVIHPKHPEFDHVGLKLRDVKSRSYLGCFDAATVERAYLLGMSTFIEPEISEHDHYAHDQMAKKLWINEEFKIVHKQEFVLDPSR